MCASAPAIDLLLVLALALGLLGRVLLLAPFLGIVATKTRANVGDPTPSIQVFRDRLGEADVDLHFLWVRWELCGHRGSDAEVQLQAAAEDLDGTVPREERLNGETLPGPLLLGQLVKIWDGVKHFLSARDAADVE